MEHSLPTPITFNIDVTDLYSEWKHWSSAFEIYVIASDLNKKEDAVQSHNAALPWPHSATHFQHAPWRTQEPWRGQDRRCFTVYRQKDPLNCKGYFNAAIRVGDKTVNWNIYVIEGNAESFIGRDSSFKLGILTHVNSVDQNDSQSELDSLLKEYDDVF